MKNQRKLKKEWDVVMRKPQDKIEWFTAKNRVTGETIRLDNPSEQDLSKLFSRICNK